MGRRSVNKEVRALAAQLRRFERWFDSAPGHLLQRTPRCDGVPRLPTAAGLRQPVPGSRLAELTEQIPKEIGRQFRVDPFRHPAVRVAQHAPVVAATSSAPETIKPAAAMPPGEALRQLAALRADGLITESEYQTKRAEILARL